MTRYNVPPVNLWNVNLFLSYATMFYLYKGEHQASNKSKKHNAS
jgi:hypothetical protein